MFNTCIETMALCRMFCSILLSIGCGDQLRYGAIALTNEESVWSLITIEQGHSFWVKTQPQSHCQNKGSHQLQREMTLRQKNA